MLKCAVQVMRWRDTRAHRPAICTRNRCTHYVQFNEQPLLAKASTILDRSLSHTYAQDFTPYKFGSTAGDRTPDLLTTRPTCYHSATALWSLWSRHHLLKINNSTIITTHVKYRNFRKGNAEYWVHGHLYGLTYMKGSQYFLSQMYCKFLLYLSSFGSKEIWSSAVSQSISTMVHRIN